MQSKEIMTSILQSSLNFISCGLNIVKTQRVVASFSFLRFDWLRDAKEEKLYPRVSYTRVSRIYAKQWNFNFCRNATGLSSRARTYRPSTSFSFLRG